MTGQAPRRIRHFYVPCETMPDHRFDRSFAEKTFGSVSGWDLCYVAEDHRMSFMEMDGTPLSEDFETGCVYLMNTIGLWTDWMARAARVGRALGAKVVVFHGNDITLTFTPDEAGEDPDAFAADMFRRHSGNFGRDRTGGAGAWAGVAMAEAMVLGRVSSEGKHGKCASRRI